MNIDWRIREKNMNLNNLSGNDLNKLEKYINERIGKKEPEISILFRDLRNGKFTYDKEIDKVCFVIDRDPQNLSENQLDDFIGNCKNNNYEVYLSNPTFELFLIMHDDRVLKVDRQEMLENRRDGRRGKRFLEKAFIIF